MPTTDDRAIGTVDRRKVSLVDVAKKCGGIILDDGELWSGAERREGKKQARKKGSETLSTPDEKGSCDFFG